MKVLVTGAGGFLGSAVMAACRAAGHEAIGLRRPAARPHCNDPSAVFGDLRQVGDWASQLAGIDAVIHCAAATSGDLPTQLAGSVLATENLLAALPGGLARFVHVSSFSVYDFTAPALWGRLDEATRIETRPLRRDAYTQTKLFQERLVREHCTARGVPLAVLRPGKIYGPGHDWSFGKTLGAGPFDLLFGGFSPIPLTHVDSCADALVRALTAPIDGDATYDIVDDDQPLTWSYHHRARRAGARVGIGLPVPYVVVLALGLAALIASKLFFRGKARLPEMFDLPRQKPQWKPLRYGNRKAKQELGWKPVVPLAKALQAMVVAEHRSGRLESDQSAS